MPRFDSHACFSALLGDPSHGRWLIAPADEPLSRKRRYRGRSLVLETEFTTSTGTVRLVDRMPPRDPRVLGTVAAIERDLMRDGFLLRYPVARATEKVDGLPKGEGVFLPCTFWLADNYALQGREDEARAILTRLLAVRNDLGLLSEEYDPSAHRLLGNFPQAFTHVSLVNTARNLSRAGGPAVDRQRRTSSAAG